MAMAFGSTDSEQRPASAVSRRTLPPARASRPHFLRAIWSGGYVLPLVATVAVAFGGTQVSYGELAHATDRLAAWLRERGAGPETLVGVRIERSIEMVAAILAIWATLACYLVALLRWRRSERS